MVLTSDDKKRKQLQKKVRRMMSKFTQVEIDLMFERRKMQQLGHVFSELRSLDLYLLEAKKNPTWDRKQVEETVRQRKRALLEAVEEASEEGAI